MTAHPDLTPEQQVSITDEELAELVRRYPYKDVARIIAALRASREELALVRRLANDSVLTLYGQCEELRAENEQLRQYADNLSRMFHGVPVQLPPLSEDEA